MEWCFAKINNRLAEVFFDEGKNGEPLFYGHCYVKREEYKTKKEQKWIDKDIEKVQLAYRKGKYRIKIGKFKSQKYQTYAPKKLAEMKKELKNPKNLISIDEFAKKL